MSGERAIYLDSSAIVKLVVHEAESPALHRYLRRKNKLVTSVLAQVEVSRAVLSLGLTGVAHANEVLSRLIQVRITNRLLRRAGDLPPVELRSLDAIHLATADSLGPELGRVCTYDERMASSAIALGMAVIVPR